jgi:hypothetical protein
MLTELIIWFAWPCEKYSFGVGFAPVGPMEGSIFFVSTRLALVPG